MERLATLLACGWELMAGLHRARAQRVSTVPALTAEMAPLRSALDQAHADWYKGGHPLQGAPP